MRYEQLEQTETAKAHPVAFKAFKLSTSGYRYGPGATHQAWVFFLRGWLAREEVWRRNKMGVGEAK